MIQNITAVSTLQNDTSFAFLLLCKLSQLTVLSENLQFEMIVKFEGAPKKEENRTEIHIDKGVSKVARRFGPMSLRPPDVSALCHLGPQTFRPIAWQFGPYKQKSSFSCSTIYFDIF